MPVSLKSVTLTSGETQNKLLLPREFNDISDANLYISKYSALFDKNGKLTCELCWMDGTSFRGCFTVKNNVDLAKALLEQSSTHLRANQDPNHKGFNRMSNDYKAFIDRLLNQDLLLHKTNYQPHQSLFDC